MLQLCLQKYSKNAIRMYFQYHYWIEMSNYSITLQSYISPENSQDQQQIIDNYLQSYTNGPKISNNHTNSQLLTPNISSSNQILLQFAPKKNQLNTVWPPTRNMNDRNRRNYKCLSNNELKKLQEQFRRGISDKNFLCEKYGVSQTSILRFLRFYRQNGHLPQRSKRESIGSQDEYSQNQYQYKVQPFEQSTSKSRKFSSPAQNNRAPQQLKDNPYQEQYD